MTLWIPMTSTMKSWRDALLLGLEMESPILNNKSTIKVFPQLFVKFFCVISVPTDSLGSYVLCLGPIIGPTSKSGGSTNHINNLTYHYL